jgi:uncharacterized protein YggE
VSRTLKFVTATLILLVLLLSGCLEDQKSGLELNGDVKSRDSDGPVVSLPIAPNQERVLAQATSADFGGTEIASPFSNSASRGIVVSGQGRLRVTPDIGVFTVGVINTGETSQETIAENARVMESVINALRNSGVDETDIKTQSVNVWPEFDYGVRDEKRDLPTIIGYRGENRVVVTIREIDKTGELIDAATAAGANQLYGLSFTVSDDFSRELRSRVLSAAVSDATEKALVIAEAIGVENISPVSIVESGGYSPPIYRYDVMALEKGAATTPISPGETEVTASVTMTFDFAT